MHKDEEWISILDKVPEKDTQVLCFYGKGYVDVLEYWYDEAGHKVFFNPPISNICDVTHWMRLPKPPKGKTYA